MSTRPFPEAMRDELRSLLTDFRHRIDADRVMVRVLEEPGGHAPAVVQVMRTGVPPVADERTIDFSNAPTFMAVRDRRAVLVQPDVVNAPPPATPPHLVELYGIRAQMLHPLAEGPEFSGLLAVHQVAKVRDWSTDDVAQLVATAEQIEAVLARYPRNGEQA